MKTYSLNEIILFFFTALFLIVFMIIIRKKYKEQNNYIGKLLWLSLAGIPYQIIIFTVILSLLGYNCGLVFAAHCGKSLAYYLNPTYILTSIFMPFELFRYYLFVIIISVSLSAIIGSILDKKKSTINFLPMLYLIYFILLNLFILTLIKTFNI